MANDNPQTASESTEPRLSDSRYGKNGPTAQLRRAIYMVLIVVGIAGMLGRIFAVNSVNEEKLEAYRIDADLGRIEAKYRREIDKAYKQKAPYDEHVKNLEAAGQPEEEIEPFRKEVERIQAAIDQAEANIPGALAAEKARLWSTKTLSRPFLSGNDRSRWCTIRVLVEPDLRIPGAPYAIDRLYDPELNPNLHLWDTVDKVYHGDRYDRDAQYHYYSSKPPLLPTLMAGPYWLIYNTTGYSLGTNPYAVGRTLLVITNIIPLIIYFLLLASLIERFGRSDWGRIFAMASAVFGTFLSTYVIVVNNHLTAAVCCAIALFAVIRIFFDEKPKWQYFVLAGIFAALTAANELPALTFLGLVGLVLLVRFPKPTLAAFTPAVLLVGLAFFGTNWIAHQSLRPPYMHRDASMQTAEGRAAILKAGRQILTPENDTDGDGRIDYEKENWYVYPNSYWINPSGIDQGEASSWKYAAHVLIGHHGLFSLSPIWLISLAGFFFWVRQNDNKKLRVMALLIATASLVCLAFYLSRPLIYRNYGGMTSGLRWMFWFAPLWIMLMLPALDRMSRRRIFRVLGYIALGFSVLSVAYPIWNPWTHPWIYNFMHYMGWN